MERIAAVRGSAGVRRERRANFISLTKNIFGADKEAKKYYKQARLSILVVASDL